MSDVLQYQSSHGRISILGPEIRNIFHARVDIPLTGILQEHQCIEWSEYTPIRLMILLPPGSRHLGTSQGSLRFLFTEGNFTVYCQVLVNKALFQVVNRGDVFIP